MQHVPCTVAPHDLRTASAAPSSTWDHPKVAILLRKCCSRCMAVLQRTCWAAHARRCRLSYSDPAPVRPHIIRFEDRARWLQAYTKCICLRKHPHARMHSCSPPKHHVAPSM